MYSLLSKLTFSVPALNESLNEVLRKPGLGVLFRSEVLQYVCELLPEIERLLKLLVTVEQQHVYRLNLRHVSMPLKLLPYLGSDLGNRHVQGVHLLNLWGRSQPVPVGLRNPGLRI